MAKLDPQQNVYYPPRQKTGALHDDFRRLYDGMYAAQRETADLRKRLEEMTQKHDGLARQVANGPSTTKIGGLNVRAAVPTNGQKLTYVAATGDIQWQ